MALNRVTWTRLEQLVARYEAVAAHDPQGLEHIALAELPESVQQSNAIESSTLTIEDTERILAGRMPSGDHDLREVYEARNLAAVTSDLMVSHDPLSVHLVPRVLLNKQLQDLGLPPVTVRARNREHDYYPLLERYATAGDHSGMERLLVLLLLESLHKRIAVLTSRRVIPLADWARAAGVRGAAATNKAKRQTIPAFRMRDRWMIASEYPARQGG